MSTHNLPDFGSPTINPKWKIAVVRSVWHPELTSAMASDCTKKLIALGMSTENILFIDAPGSFELPLLAKRALEAGADAAIVFGVIVQGETHHADLIAREAAAGCMQVQLVLGKPVIFEVIFVNDRALAEARAKGEGGKGSLAAMTTLSQLAKLAELRS